MTYFTGISVAFLLEKILAMFKNHLKIAFRNLLRYPGFSLLNISGLALGMAASFVLLIYVQQETSYDEHFSNSEKIVRIASDFYDMGGFARTSESLYHWLKDECKEVKLATAFNPLRGETPIEVFGSSYLEGRALSADSNFFRVFSFPMLEGNPNHLLKNADEVVLTERLARKYFGAAPAIGELVYVGKEKTPYRVSGVVKADDRKTHIEADLFLPLELKDRTNWTSSAIFVYAMLHDEATIGQLEVSLEGLRKNRIYPTFQNETSYESWATGSHRVEYFVQPLQDIYLHSDFQFDLTAGGNPALVRILGVIGLFLIFIAMVNYINLTTARSSVRAKEVGVKKTMGAIRHTLVQQFLVEAVLISLLAMVLAGGLTELLLVIFEKITGELLIDTIFNDPVYLLMLLGLSVMIGLAAGAYPAFYLTRFQPVKILQGKFGLRGNARLRGGLVVFQFAIAISLLVGTTVVYRQLAYMQNMDKGFEQEGVLIVTNTKKLGSQKEAFRQEVERLPQVAATSYNDRMPGGNFLWMYTYQTPDMDNSITVQTFPADENYVGTLGLRLQAGRNFSKDIASDSTAVILNEAAVSALGLNDKDPIGAIVNEGGYHVVGVVQDFNFQSLREKIEPTIMMYGTQGNRLAIKLKGNQIANFLTDLDGKWQLFHAETPIAYTFLDDNFAKLAAQEKMLGQAVAFFTSLAILIACIGLFGLAAFMAERRTKELGIRKVLGATTASLVSLMSRDFLRLVVIALLVATPVAWYFMNNWLHDFAYRIDLEWWVFALAGATAIAVAFLTVSFQSIKAALANPVNSLRSE
ncbi:MAG: ABC transporter permease [Bacteroidota bacterium]